MRKSSSASRISRYFASFAASRPARFSSSRRSTSGPRRNGVTTTKPTTSNSASAATAMPIPWTTIRPPGLTYDPRGERLNRVKAALAAGIALAALAITPTAEAAKRGWIYDVKEATGFEHVVFTGDQDGGCELYNVCGYSGDVRYKLSG